QNRTPRATRSVRPPATAAAGNGSGNVLMPGLETFVTVLPVALPNVAPSLNVVAKPRLSFGPAVFWVTVVFHVNQLLIVKKVVDIELQPGTQLPENGNVVVDGSIEHAVAGERFRAAVVEEHVVATYRAAWRVGISGCRKDGKLRGSQCLIPGCQAVGEPRLDPPHPRHRYVSGPAHRLVVDAPDSKSVSLETREVSVRIGPRRAERFGEISDEGRIPRQVGPFTFIVAGVFSTEACNDRSRSSGQTLDTSTETPRLVFAMGDVRVLIQHVGGQSGVHAVDDDVGHTGVERLEMVDQAVGFAVDVGNLRSPLSLRQRRAVRRRELVDQRRLQIGRNEHVGERCLDDGCRRVRVVRQIKIRERSCRPGRQAPRYVKLIWDGFPTGL